MLGGKDPQTTRNIHQLVARRALVRAGRFEARAKGGVREHAAARIDLGRKVGAVVRGGCPANLWVGILQHNATKEPPRVRMGGRHFEGGTAHCRLSIDQEWTDRRRRLQVELGQDLCGDHQRADTQIEGAPAIARYLQKLADRRLERLERLVVASQRAWLQISSDPFGCLARGEGDAALFGARDDRDQCGQQREASARRRRDGDSREDEGAVVSAASQGAQHAPFAQGRSLALERGPITLGERAHQSCPQQRVVKGCGLRLAGSWRGDAAKQRAEKEAACAAYLSTTRQEA